MPRLPDDQPGAHYDAVTSAWQFLMGESFHYGLFERADAPLDDATAALTRRMAERAALGAGQRVLDVGCGIGGPARFLAQEFGCEVVGISTSEVGVREARARSEAAGLAERVSFLVRDGMDSGFEDAAFERVWVMESSHLMPDKARLIEEASRVLAPGGRFVLCDIVMHRALPIHEVVQRAQAFDLLRRVFGRARMETLDAYSGWLEAADLRVDACEDLSALAAPTFERWQANAERFRAEVDAAIGEPARVDFSAACDALRAMWGEGILGYGLVSAHKPG